MRLTPRRWSRSQSRHQQRTTSAKKRARLRRGFESLEPRQLLAVVTGQVFTDTNGNGDRDIGEAGLANIRVYVDANDNGTLDDGELGATTASNGTYAIESVPSGDVVVRVVPPSGRVQSSPQQFIGLEFVDDTASNLFEMSEDGTIRTSSAQVSFNAQGIVQTNDGTIFLLEDDLSTFHAFDPQTQVTSLVGQAAGQTSAFGLAYDNQTDTIFAVAQEVGGADNLYRLHIVDRTDGSLGPALTDGLALTAPSTLAFDSVSNRLVGFDNGTKQFFEYPIGRAPEMLGFASRSFNGYSLAFDGDRFLMFDQGVTNVDSRSVIEVNPETGTIRSGFFASSPVLVSGLHHSPTGNAAVRFDSAGISTVVSAEFGLTRIDPLPQPEDNPPVISEILVEGVQVDEDKDQYLEFRGQPGGSFGDGTYFVIIDEDDQNAGEIHGIFDLSNQAFGANGYLVIQQQNASDRANPFSRVLQSDLPGFDGLPGDIYSDIHPISERIDFTVGPNTYVLLQSDTPPQLDDDIDQDDDGLADAGGLLDTWNVLDSISIHPNVLADDQAYGQILLAEESTVSNDPFDRTVAPGTPIVVATGFGYAGRIGESIGSSAEDWVFGEVDVTDADDLSSSTFELDGRFREHPTPIAFHSRDLDHLGEANFVGGVRGTITLDPAFDSSLDENGDPIPSQPAAGLTVLADTNGNGTRDLLTFVVDPDDGIDLNSTVPTDDQLLADAFDGVSLSRTLTDNRIWFNTIRSSDEASNAFGRRNRVFSDTLDSFSESRKLRFDFFDPVSSVSIEAIARDLGSFASFGRLEAYDANDQLIGSATSTRLVGSQRQVITVDSLSENIAYGLAFGVDLETFTTFDARFDNLSYQQLEKVDVTDVNGQYSISPLRPGSYDIITVLGDNESNLIGGEARDLTVRRFENFVVNDSFRPNSAPTITPIPDVLVDENTPAGTQLLQISATDLDGQIVTFEATGGDIDVLVVDEETGAVRINDGAVFDFETQSSYTLTVAASDGFAISETVLRFLVTDLNEPPVVNDIDLFINERSAVGTAIGQIQAFDPDAAGGSSVTFDVTGGSGQNTFSVDPSTGVVSLIDDTLIDFFTNNTLTLNVTVSDTSDPPLTTTVDQIIRIIDQNDPPLIVGGSFAVEENSTGVVGQLSVEDRDINQTHTFSLAASENSNLFMVASDGRIIVRPDAEIDFEQNPAISLTVRAVDSGSPPIATESVVTLTLLDVNEAATVSPRLFTIDENSAGATEAGTLAVVDPEDGPAVRNVELIDSDDAADFEFDPQTLVISVSEGANLDFETDPTKILRFRVIDPAGQEPDSEAVVRIDLNDRNDPPVFLTTTLFMSELAAPGTFVGQSEIDVQDLDGDDAVTLQIVGGTAQNSFLLDANSSRLIVADGAVFDADIDSDPLTLQIQATDQAGAASEGTVTILLNNVNEAPVITQAPPTGTAVTSGERLRLAMPIESVNDPENGPIEFAVFDSTGTLPSWLSFDSETGILSGLATPQVVGTYDLTFRAFERGPLSLQNNVTFSFAVDAETDPLTNKRDPLDVDDNGTVAASDALRVLNYIARFGNVLSTDPAQPFNGFVDTSGNLSVTALDALLIINALRQGSSTPAALPEGEWGLLADQDESDIANDAALGEYLSEAGLF